MKKALALLVILPTLALAQLPQQGSSPPGSGTVSGTTGLPACFTGDTVVGNCTSGQGIKFVAGVISVDDADTPRFYTGAGAPSAANTAGRDIYQDTTNIRFYRGIGGTSWIETQRVSSGSGAPAASACDAAAEAGYLYYRTDNTSGMSPLYSCGQTGAGTYGWLLTLAGTRSGDTTEFATVSGTKTVSKQLAFDASGNIIASASDIGGGAAATSTQFEFPYQGMHILAASSNPMGVADRVYVDRVVVPVTLTSMTTWYFRVGTASASSSWYWGLFSIDGNTRHINCTASGAAVATVTCTVSVTVTAGEYWYAHAASDITTACLAYTGGGTTLAEGAKLRAYATNTVSAGSLPATLGVLTYTGAGEYPCASVLANY